MKKKTPSSHPATVRPAVKTIPIEQEPQRNTVIKAAPTIDELVGLAVQGNYDLDKLQRILDMKEAFDKKQAKRAFDEALARFQEECPPILKNRSGWDSKYRYADAAEIEKVIKPFKAKHGFSHKFKYAQVPGPHPFENDLWIQVTCVLSHSGGHSEETTLSGPPDHSVNKDGKATKNPIQSSGSTVTYLERYTLKGALGLSTTQDDTDGINQDVYDQKGSKDTGLPLMGDLEFEKVIQKVRSEGWTLEKIEQSWTLGPDQRSAIETILKAKKV